MTILMLIFRVRYVKDYIVGYALGLLLFISLKIDLYCDRVLTGMGCISGYDSDELRGISSSVCVLSTGRRARINVRGTDIFVLPAHCTNSYVCRILCMDESYNLK